MKVPSVNERVVVTTTLAPDLTGHAGTVVKVDTRRRNVDVCFDMHGKRPIPITLDWDQIKIEGEQCGTKDTNPKDAIGCKKPPLSTLSMPVLFEMGNGMLEGACKYRRHNFREAGVRASVYFDAAMRHLAAFWEGEDIDPDSGMSHVTKILTCLMVLRDSMIIGNWVDDRPPKAPADWIKDAQKQTDDVLARYPDPLPPYTQI